MQIVIVGAAGMLGRKLVAALLKRGTLARADGTQARIERVALLDNVPFADMPADPRVTFTEGDVYDPTAIKKLIAPGTTSVFHFAAVVSAGAEADLELGYRVNLDGTRVVLDACRALGTCPRVVFTSSVAVYGGDMPDTIPDNFALTPQTSYGTQKAMGELLINDYTRRGLIDGRALRLPTIVVRPGKPNLAASTFASSIIREPLSGQDAVCPVGPATMMPLLSPRKAVEAFLRAHDLPPSAWGTNRALHLPSLDVSVQEMADGLKRVAGAAAYQRIKWQPEPRIQKIVETWPGRLNSKRARAMGFESDASMEAIINAFIEDDLRANAR